MNATGQVVFGVQLRQLSITTIFSSLRNERDLNTEEVLVHKLHIACEAHYYDVAWGLIDEFGADVNALFRLLGTAEAHEKSPLYRACSSHNYAEVELPTADFTLKLMQRGADINYFCADTTPLQMSLRRGRLDIARELLLRGASGQAPPHSSVGQRLDILLSLR
jgi:ankyrin repeat protein